MHLESNWRLVQPILPFAVDIYISVGLGYQLVVVAIRNTNSTSDALYWLARSVCLCRMLQNIVHAGLVLGIAACSF